MTAARQTVVVGDAPSRTATRVAGLPLGSGVETEPAARLRAGTGS